MQSSHLRSVHCTAEAAENVFFLHVPRTAGRTYYFCFMKLATPPSRRCEKSYDVLRLNSSIPDCGLLGSHDDLSVMQYLPRDTAVVTQLRHAAFLTVLCGTLPLTICTKFAAPQVSLPRLQGTGLRQL